MGKGDKKTKRGKIFAGSYGKYRLKPQRITKLKKIAGQNSDDSNNKKEDKE